MQSVSRVQNLHHLPQICPGVRLAGGLLKQEAGVKGCNGRQGAAIEVNAMYRIPRLGEARPDHRTDCRIAEEQYQTWPRERDVMARETSKLGFERSSQPAGSRATWGEARQINRCTIPADRPKHGVEEPTRRPGDQHIGFAILCIRHICQQHQSASDPAQGSWPTRAKVGKILGMPDPSGKSFYRGRQRHDISRLRSGHRVRHMSLI